MTVTAHVLYHLKHICDISHLAYTRNTGQVTTHLDLSISKTKQTKNIHFKEEEEENAFHLHVTGSLTQV